MRGQIRLVVETAKLVPGTGYGRRYVWAGAAVCRDGVRPATVDEAVVNVFAYLSKAETKPGWPVSVILDPAGQFWLETRADESEHWRVLDSRVAENVPPLREQIRADNGGSVRYDHPRPTKAYSVTWESADGKVGGNEEFDTYVEAGNFTDAKKADGFTVRVRANPMRQAGSPLPPDFTVTPYRPRVPARVSVAVEVVKAVAPSSCCSPGDTDLDREVRNAALTVLKEFLTTPDGAT